MKVMKTSSLTVVVATLGPGASNSELPNFFQFWGRGGRKTMNRGGERGDPTCTLLEMEQEGLVGR